MIAVLILSYFLAEFFGSFFLAAFPKEGGGWINFSNLVIFLIGFPLAYLFFLFLLFTAFGNQHKKWWIGIASLPALAFLLYFDFSHIYFHVLFPVAGWLIGLGVWKRFF